MVSEHFEDFEHSEDLPKCFPKEQHLIISSPYEISPHPCQHLLLSVFLLCPYLQVRGGEVTTIAAFLCVSLMTNDAENLLMCLLAIWIIFFGEMFIQILCPFLSWAIYLFSIAIFHTCSLNYFPRDPY